jgi:undecaprenyl-diphosphatase
MSQALPKKIRPELTIPRIIISAICCFALFALFTVGLKLGWWEGMDRRTAEMFPSLRMDWLNELLVLFSELGSTLAFVLLFTAASGVLLYRKRVLEAGVLFLAIVGSFGLNSVLKDWIGRERPAMLHLVEADGYSFPSGNTMVAASFYGMIALLLLRLAPGRRSSRAVWLIAMILLLIGFSRVYLNVHYPTDVLAGYAAGAGWMLVCSLILVRKGS